MRETIGYIYIMTNNSFREGMLKIGYATDVEKRKKELSNTSVPTDFNIYATFPVAKNAADKSIHKLIDLIDDEVRVNKSREFYYLDPKKAFDIINTVAEISDVIGPGQLYNMPIDTDNEMRNVEQRIRQISDDATRRDITFSRIANFLNIPCKYHDAATKRAIRFKSALANVYYQIELKSRTSLITIGLSTKADALNDIDTSDMENNFSNDGDVKHCWYNIDVENVYDISDDELNVLAEVFNLVKSKIEE